MRVVTGIILFASLIRSTRGVAHFRDQRHQQDAPASIESGTSKESFRDETTRALRSMGEKLEAAERMLNQEYSLISSKQSRNETKRVVRHTWLPNPAFEQRVERCVDIVRGGSEVLPNELRKALRAVPKLEDVCPVLKRLKFPPLSKHGFASSVYKTLENHKVPEEMDGDLYLSTAKNAVFKCLCEF